MSSESSTSATPATTHDASHGDAAHGGSGHGELTHAGHDDVAHAAVPHEQPSDWGWNGEWGKWASRGGWFVVILLLLMFAGVTHYNKGGFIGLAVVILGLVAILVWDGARKRHSWRK